MSAKNPFPRADDFVADDTGTLLYQKYVAHLGGLAPEVEVARDGEVYLARSGGGSSSIHWEETGLGQISLEVDGSPLEIRLTRLPDGTLRIEKESRQFAVRVEDDLSARARLAQAHHGGPIALRSPMPGLVVKVLVENGQTVALEEPVLIIEAMKMQNELNAPAAGVIQNLTVRPGEAVDGDQLLLEVKP